MLFAEADEPSPPPLLPLTSSYISWKFIACDILPALLKKWISDLACVQGPQGFAYLLSGEVYSKFKWRMV